MNNNIHPDNAQSTSSQNVKQANYLLLGNWFHGDLEAHRQMGIGVVGSRMGSLHTYFGLRPFLIQVGLKEIAANGKTNRYQKYSILPENINAAKEHLRSTHRKFHEEIIALGA